MRVRLTSLLFCLVLLNVAATTRVAHAVNVSVDQALSEDVVEVNEPVTVTLQVSLDEDVTPQSPELKVPPGFKTSRVNTSTMKIQINASFRRDYTARWVIIPNKTGVFDIGPPAVQIEGTRVTGKSTLSLKVVEPGQAPPRKQGGARPRRPSGFGGMASFFAPKSPFDLDDSFFEFKAAPRALTTSRDLNLRRSLAPHAFTYIHADKSEAVVGEQITLSYWVYHNVDLLDLEDYKEPPLSAFTREDLSVPASTRRRNIRARVGGQLYGARQYGQVAVFPVRPGKLHTGKWSAKLEVLLANGRRLLPRESNDVVIDVKPAPAKGQPLGFQSGTVGRFKMKADLSPRKTFAGDTISVTVQVTGVGQLPSELKLPSKMGIEWLKPDRKEGISLVHGNVGGWRTFDYAVRFTEAGEYDLGNVELPYWDPDKKQYEVATAELGKVVVTENPNKLGDEPTPTDPSEADAPDPFEGIAGPRSELGAYDGGDTDGIAPRTLWTWVLTPPLGVALSSLAAAWARRARRRRQKKADDPATRARQALSEASDATDAKDAAAATERALHLAIEAATGLKSRGMRKDELRDALDEALDDDQRVAAIARVFEACSTVRFEPDADEERIEEVCSRGAKVVKALLKS